MYLIILIQFRMECEGELVFIFYGYDSVFYCCEYLYAAVSCFCYIRGTDEGHRDFSDSLQTGFCMEAAELSSVGIALHGHWHSL